MSEPQLYRLEAADFRESVTQNSLPDSYGARFEHLLALSVSTATPTLLLAVAHPFT